LLPAASPQESFSRSMANTFGSRIGDLRARREVPVG
jgi:hypothetical protein